MAPSTESAEAADQVAQSANIGDAAASPDPALEDLSVAKLKKIADDRSLDVGDASTKAELIDAINRGPVAVPTTEGRPPLGEVAEQEGRFMSGAANPDNQEQ